MTKGLTWFLRRTEDPEILEQIKDIVSEGFEYVTPCEFMENGYEFLSNIVYGSTQTFINSYTEFEDITESEVDYIYDFIENKFKRLILTHYNYWIENFCE